MPFRRRTRAFSRADREAGSVAARACVKSFVRVRTNQLVPIPPGAGHLNRDHRLTDHRPTRLTRRA